MTDRVVSPCRAGWCPPGFDRVFQSPIGSTVSCGCARAVRPPRETRLEIENYFSFFSRTNLTITPSGVRVPSVIPKTSSFVRFKPLLLIPFSAALWPGLLAAWTPGTYPAGSSGFTVDTAVRNDVVSFWHGVYQASEGYQNRIGWTGNYTAPAPSYNGQGTTSAAFVADVARRVNFYRAMCGVPATVLFNTGSTVVIDPTDTYRTTTNPALAAATTKAAAAQQGAYMTSRTAGASDTGSPTGKPFAGFSHTPVAADCVAWTTAAWNANYHGNIGLGFYGPGAVDAYILENVAGLSEWNSSVGHRRWLLYPPATNLATGDT